MSQYVETPTRTFKASAAIAAHLRVKDNGSGLLEAAGAGDEDLGVLENAALAANDVVSVRLPNAQGTTKMTAGAAITAYAKVYAAAGGKIDDVATGVRIGIALEAATADGDIIEVLRDRADTAPTAQSVTPDDSDSALNAIQVGVTAVDVQAVTNDANDYITLPALASVPVGHTITIVCNAGTNFELRTPAASGEEINSEDCDGTKEYLCTDTEVVKVIKISDTIGWMAHAFSAIGAVVTAVVPD